jgi:hypothetical protein
MDPDQVERKLCERLDAPDPAPRAELFHVLILPDLDRADRIGEFWGEHGDPHLRTLRAVLVGMLHEAERSVHP